MTKKRERFKLFGNDSTKEKLLCGLAATLFPTTIFVYFCAQNTRELRVWFMAAASLVVWMAAAAAYLVSLVLFRRAFPTSVFCVVCWIGCYMEPTIHGHMNEALALYLRSMVYGRGIFISLIILIAAVCLSLLSYKVHDAHRTVLLFITATALVLAFNIVAIIGISIKGGASPDDGTRFKTQFVREDGLASPDIYWIHMDGMLSFDAVEKYYGDPQEDLVISLQDRGFQMNPSANFEAAHSTSIAIPILVSPYAYDQWVGDLTSTHEAAMTRLGGHNNLKDMRALRVNGELQAAFATQAYDVNVVGPFDYYYPPDGGHMWLTEAMAERKVVLFDKSEDSRIALRVMIRDVANISGYFSFFLCSPIDSLIAKYVDYYNTEDYRTRMTEEQLRSIMLEGYNSAVQFKNAKRDQIMIEGLYDVLYGGYSSPRLTFIHVIGTHCPFYCDENGTIIRSTENRNPLDYYPQHIWSAKVMVNMIDMILAVDPDAVIVIQSDHGLHGNTEEDFKAAFGEDADAIELWNSTMSAIRVPEKYQTGEEHYAMENPLNISRYLVNSFVGRNYEYLPAN